MEQGFIFVNVQNGEGTIELAIRNSPFNYNQENKGGLALSIRPESIKILEKETEGKNIFKGTVEEVHFFGSLINVIVRVQELKLQVNALNNSLSRNLQAGSHIWVELPEEQMRIIPVVTGDNHD